MTTCDFSTLIGPAATIIAAGAAVFVTWCIGQRQLGIAESQRDIARDKLRCDLFEKQYDIFLAAQALAKCAILYGGPERATPDHIRDLRIKIDEARFFFPDQVRAFTTELDKACEAVFFKTDTRQTMGADAPDWIATGDKLAGCQAKVREMYAQLPSRFEPALRFEQLTRSQSIPDM
jgi:hypothetical protein